MTQTVTEAYLLGIKEGRDYCKRYDLTLEEMRQEVESLNAAIARHGDTMKDVFKGQRDFWLNQIKKKG